MNDDKWQRTVAKRRRQRRIQNLFACFIVLLVLLILSIIGGYYYYQRTNSPEHALEELQTAFEHRDIDTIHKYVDFKTLLPPNYKILTNDIFINDKIYTEKEHNIYQTFYALIEPIIVNGAIQSIDKYIQTGNWQRFNYDSMLKGRQLGIDYTELINRSLLFNISFKEIKSIETIDDNSYNDTSVPPTAGDELDADTKTTSEGGIIGDDLMNLFSKVRDYLNNSKENTVSTGSRHTAPDTTAIPEEFANSDRSSSDNNTEHKAPATPVPKTRIYSFESMDDFIDASKVINHIYNDPSYLYKKSGSDRYYLIMQRCCCSSVDFNKVCNILSEYALKETSNEALFAFFKEHGDCIIAKHAINVAANL